ncbi:MAG: hypothetical protein H6726_19135 [Sandaracinaceae bacterium]|nr:hypothetical protein [Sandaracinaceae bacterium]
MGVLTYDASGAGPSCPSESDFRAAIASRLGRDAVVAGGNVTLHVTITRSGGTYSGTFVTASGGGPESARRELSSSACSSLVDALASSIALALEPVVAPPGVSGVELDPDLDARALAAMAARAYESGAFLRAFELYRAAYDLSPRPALLYNIALAADRLGALNEAADAYGRYVAATDHGARSRVIAERRREIILQALTDRAAMDAAHREEARRREEASRAAEDARRDAERERLAAEAAAREAERMRAERDAASAREAQAREALLQPPSELAPSPRRRRMAIGVTVAVLVVAGAATSAVLLTGRTRYEEYTPTSFGQTVFTLGSRP